MNVYQVSEVPEYLKNVRDSWKVDAKEIRSILSLRVDLREEVAALPAEYFLEGTPTKPL